MKISLNWVKEFTDVKLPVDELVAAIGAQLGEVEEVVDVGKPYQHIVIADVVECQKHPNADKLHICKIDDGGVVKNVPRDENGLVQVVCGAPNVRAGLAVAWLPPGAVVPSTYDKERFVIEARELRGVTSNGMLASAAELGIGDNHDGLLEIDVTAKPGTPFADAYQLDDTIIDIENKMFTHRPDCFGILGVARELAGITHRSFSSPSWYIQPTTFTSGQSDAIKAYGVTNQIGELCPRYMLIAIDNVTVGPSPVWLQTYLSRVGIRPINNIVDMTNYLMVLTGQPLHAFDFDKVAVNGTANIVVRKPKKGEKMTLLDGKTITPRADAILICDQDKPIALGGVMGGNNSEIDSGTTRILIECANFDMYNIRRTVMEHGLFTDSVTRFTKGQSPWQCAAVLHSAVAMVQELCSGAMPIGKPVDAQDTSVERRNQAVTVTPQFINERLGVALNRQEITKLLTNVEFEVSEKNNALRITAPFWRTDIAIPEDIVEEVGRLYGYDHLPLVLPQRGLAPAPTNDVLSLKKQIRNVLSGAGASEVLTYSFVHGNLLEKVGQDPKLAFQLSNALSPDLQYYRLSLTPSLLDKVHANIKAGTSRFAIFEIGKTHDKKSLQKDGLPVEEERLALVFTADGKQAAQYHGSAYYEAKTYAEYVLGRLGFTGLVFEPSTTHEPKVDTGKQCLAPFERNRTAYIKTANGELLGMVGEVKPGVKKGCKLPDFTAAFELDLLQVLKLRQPAQYRPLSRFPKTQQDISFKVKDDVAYQTLRDLLQVALTEAETEHGYESTIEPLDIYRADNDTAHKHIAFRITLTHPDRTLTTEEVNRLLNDLAEAAHKTVKATRL